MIGLAQAAAQSTQFGSLGDLARKLREEKTKSATKSVKVYTNDNIPKNVVIGVAPMPVVETAAPQASAGEIHDEKYYRKAKQEIVDRKQMHERELEVLQQKLGQNNMQFYADPNKSLQQEYSRTDITKLQEDIDKKKAQIADDDKALSDLEDQLRREGGEPGWLR
ncbi:MAG: hypothetical protein DMG21_12165 [Acidobacteria bacterium]|nr:MAG: hypothetical protein DMG21_12165 [Acidobacteriota bacterium]